MLYLKTCSKSSLALKWFNADGGEPEKYEGQRDLEALAGLSVARLDL